MHGGRNQRAKRGSKKTGGRPAETGLYAKYLREHQLRSDYDEALTTSGTIAHELAVARAYYARLIRRRGASATVILLAEKIAKLELLQIRIAAGNKPPQEVDLYEAWKASVTSGPKSPHE